MQSEKPTYGIHQNQSTTQIEGSTPLFDWNNPNFFKAGVQTTSKNWTKCKNVCATLHQPGVRHNLQKIPMWQRDSKKALSYRKETTKSDTYPLRWRCKSYRELIVRRHSFRRIMGSAENLRADVHIFIGGNPLYQVRRRAHDHSDVKTVGYGAFGYENQFRGLADRSMKISYTTSNFKSKEFTC